MTYRHATIVGSLTLLLALAAPIGAHASLTKCSGDVSPDTIQKENWIRLQLPIPNVTISCLDDMGTPDDIRDDVSIGYVKDMGAYIGGLYKYFVGVIGIFATAMVFWGGLQWLTAGGNAGNVKSAKETIFSALIAIVITFGSYTLLFTINKKLVQINPPVLKVADTFLVSFDNTCPTTKVCLSGTNVGRPCTTDAACPGASGGVCGLPLLDESGNEVTKAECGTRYTFKKVLGGTAPSETCLGSYCDAKTYVIGGTVQLKCLGDKNWTTQPATGETMSCKAPSLHCDAVSENDPSKSNCAIASVPGVGMCRFVDKAIYNIVDNDACVWSKPLVCDTGYTRIGCDKCIGLAVSCKASSSGALLNEIISSFSSEKRICDSVSEGEVVYGLDPTIDGKGIRSICCQKTICVGGTSAGVACTDSSTCGTGECKPNFASINKDDFQCKSSNT